MIQTTFENVNHNVLIIDNDPRLAHDLLEAFARRGIRGVIANNKKTAYDYLDQNIWNLVFVNSEFAHRTGSSHLLGKIKSHCPELPVVMLSLSDSAESAVSALRAGYSEFLVKPLSVACIEKLIDTFLPNHKTRILEDSYRETRCIYQIVGTSDELIHTIRLAKKVAPTSAPVLITGQSGTGKELIAQLIHDKSQRANAPFIKVNCAALNDSLLESELFGHEKGAFTGALTQHIGRFERAHGGTILLDEITETKTSFQTKLLRVIEQMAFERVGGNENINVNVRIISTTNSDILKEVREGRFRADLYYRLAGLKLVIPPLRNRKEDIPQLVWFFINQFAQEAKRQINSIDPATFEIFDKYHWPGNIRQLSNVVRSALILGSGKTFSLSGMSSLIDELQSHRPTGNFEYIQLANETLEELEQKAILATLSRTEGNKAKAAKALGISDRTLRDKIKRYRQEESLQMTG